MTIKPFSERTTEEYIGNKKQSLLHRIDRLTNEEIMANDIEILTENLYQEFFVIPVTIHEEDFSKRSINQEKTKKYVDPFFEGYSDRRCVDVDGVVAEFYFPFDGDKELFRCRASTFSLGGYPQIEICDNEIVFKIIKTIDEVKHLSKDKLLEGLEESLKKIKQGISYANKDITQYNSELKLFIWKKLNEKKTKVETYFDFAKMLEVPIEKKEYAKKHISIQRKIVPISHEYKNEDYYDIKDSDYKDILESIKHTLTTYERTPSSYKSMQEEDLRNTLLATLNATYKGNATGETFRNNGKTDICIELENRAAFVAECKMWTGSKEVADAVIQLDSYLTWRDCKTALIYFVKRKDFLKVLDRAKEALKEVDGMRNVRELDKNEFDCLFLSKSNVGQQISVRVMFFNLYSE